MSEPRTVFGQVMRHLQECGAASCDRLDVLLAEWTDDELDVMGVGWDRMNRSRVVYGPLDLETDERDFDAEAAEEAADRLAYRAMAKLSRETFAPVFDALPAVNVRRTRLRSVPHLGYQVLIAPADGLPARDSFDAEEYETEVDAAGWSLAGIGRLAGDEPGASPFGDEQVRWMRPGGAPA